MAKSKAELEAEKELEAKKLETKKFLEAEKLEVKKLADEKLKAEKLKAEKPEVVVPTQGVKGEKLEKVKFIKEMGRMYIAGNYYSGSKNETKMLPEFVAQIVRGDNGKRETFAV